MEQVLLMYESSVRLGAFFGVFVLMALWEVAAPARQLTVPRSLRWTSNLAIVAFNTFLARTLAPMAPMAFAFMVAERGGGVLNHVDWPLWAEVVLSIAALDFAIWAQHLMVHRVPFLWRLHRMHHADLDYDVTTGARFHPLEILLSLVIKFCVIAALGPPAVAVVLFEVILNAMAMFNHANVRLPSKLDHILRFVFVTPDFHRVHHSIHADEMHRNFGFNLSIWDRVFGTYTPQPKDGHEGMTIGLEQFRAHKDERLDQMLIQPFK